jgi:hypothetical protein
MDRLGDKKKRREGFELGQLDDLQVRHAVWLIAPNAR